MYRSGLPHTPVFLILFKSFCIFLWENYSNWQHVRYGGKTGRQRHMAHPHALMGRQEMENACTAPTRLMARRPTLVWSVVVYTVYTALL